MPTKTNYVMTSVKSGWTHAEQAWELNSQSRLVIDPGSYTAESTLQQVVDLIQAEMAEGVLPYGKLPVVQGAAAEAEPGDIFIELEPSADPDKQESYTLEIGAYIHLRAASGRAVLYALRALFVQAAREQRLAFGTVTDYPVMKERALHLDMGRKFFSCDWIKARIREMSGLRLNTLQLHFSENEGYRLESKRHPEVMSEAYMTQDELAEVLKEAAAHQVTIIPSFDSPGHLGHALRLHQEWLLHNREGQAAKGALDITNPQAKAFVFDLLEEYAELFKDSPYFHIGGDEFIDFEHFGQYPQLAEYARETLGVAGGTGIDAYLHYINEVADMLEGKGFVVRAWNDGLYRANQTQRVELKTSIQITYWTKWHQNMASVQTIMDQGHELINFNDAYFYYVLGENAGYKYPTGDKIYDAWHPGLFPRVNETEKQEYLAPYPPQLKGCSFAIWSDKPEAQTEEEVSTGIQEPLIALAELSWIGEKRMGSFAEVKAAFAALS